MFSSEFGSIAEWTGLLGGIAGLVGGAAGLWALRISRKQMKWQEEERAFNATAESWCRKTRDSFVESRIHSDRVEEEDRKFAEWGIEHGYFERVPGPGVHNRGKLYITLR